MNLEDKYLKLLVPNYNILTEAGSSFGYKHTEIDRQKMKDIYSDASTLRVREIIGNLNKGKKFSRPLFNVVGTETIERMREKALIRPPNPYNPALCPPIHARPVLVLHECGGPPPPLASPGAK